MDHHPRDDNKDGPKHHFQFNRDFVLNDKTGIYEPETCKGKTAGSKERDTINILAPLPVEVKRDRISVLFALLATIISCATLVVVAKYTYYAGGQLRAMQETNTIASISASAAVKAANSAVEQIGFSRDALHTAERPWIVHVGKEIPKLMPNVVFMARLAILNTGKAPGLDSRVSVQARYFKKFPLPNPPYDKPMGSPGQSHNVMAPNIAYPLQVKLYLTDEEFRQIEKREVVYYIYGEIRYTDAFTPPHEHVTHFCIQYHPEELPNGTVWAACESYDTAS
jgi:hypothetical protein